jgi:hypothetical protein
MKLYYIGFVAFLNYRAYIKYYDELFKIIINIMNLSRIHIKHNQNAFEY